MIIWGASILNQHGPIWVSQKAKTIITNDREQNHNESNLMPTFNLCPRRSQLEWIVINAKITKKM